MQYIVALIHNNTLGKVTAVESEEAGKELIRSMAEEVFNRLLTLVEINSLVDSGEIYNDSDVDNVFTFTLGVLE
jgi:hypothetical protein